MKKTDLAKPNPPPKTNHSSNTAFTYEPEKKEPTLDQTNPVAASLLHIVMMTTLVIIAAVSGIIFLFTKSPNTSWSSPTFWTITGAVLGITYLHKLLKKE